MKIIRTFLATLLIVSGYSQNAYSQTVYYDFNGSCISAFGNGCSTYGLSNGENVSGVFSFDESLVVPGAKIQPIGQSTPGMNFSFTFGNTQFTKSDLMDVSFTVVEFSTSDASTLVGYGTQTNPVEYATGWAADNSIVVFGQIFGSQVFVREREGDIFVNGAYANGVWTRRLSVEVEIDVKPGSDKNPVNPKSRGVIPVAIMGSADFDATQVDYTKVRFGPNEASPIHDGHIVDVNSDGFADVLFHFNTIDTGIECGVTHATLTGETFGGSSISGTDAVKTVACK